MSDEPVVPWRPLEDYRNYLRVLAQVQIGPQLQAKFDASDLAQQTLLKAHQCRDQFRGHSEGEQAAWLRTILANTVREALRKHGGKRQEGSLGAALDESSARLEALIAGDQFSRQEKALWLSDALASLPDQQRQAVELRHLHGYSVEAIAELMGRPVNSVAGLLRRGLENLRKLLDSHG
jgi:RNA polymerase sigma-70 factor (ECF subfamily)